MRLCTWIFVLFMVVVPALAQEPEDGTQNIGGQFALGNLAVRDATRANDPVTQLKKFFEDVKLPLAKEQEQKLDGMVEAQQKELRALRDRSPGSDTNDAIRRLNTEYLKLVNSALTSEQQASWRHYRIEQLRLRGGFPALKAILEQSSAPLAADQGKSIEKIFDNFSARRAELIDSNPKAGIADMDRLVIAEFDRVVALLTPEQRLALQRSRRPAASANAKQ